MKHEKIEEIEKRLQDDIKYTLSHESKDEFIDIHFQMGHDHGLPNDNSMELSYRYSVLESIKNDPCFLEKMRFVLNNYARFSINLRD